jgi:hypothetical protein
MSKRKNQIKKTTFGARLSLLVPGFLMIAFSYFAISRDVWWIPGFSQKFGHATFSPALTFGGVGFLLILLGLLPWNHFSKERKNRHF